MTSWIIDAFIAMNCHLQVTFQINENNVDSEKQSQVLGLDLGNIPTRFVEYSSTYLF